MRGQTKRPEEIPVLRLSKNLRFSDNLCLDFAKHGREKVPVQKLFLSQSIKSQAHVLTFYAFVLQMLFDTRCCAYYCPQSPQYFFDKLKTGILSGLFAVCGSKMVN